MEPKITLLKKLLVVFIIMMTTLSIYSQNLKQFIVKNEGTFPGIKGDMLLIGNNVMNRNLAPNGPNVPFNGTGNNNSYNMQYVDIDGDASTFNSSTADLRIPVATQGCYQIRADPAPCGYCLYR